MHILSQQNRSEFLACPQLIRFDYANGSETTLLIKCSTLLLKYVVLGVPMQLGFSMCDNRLLYALRICDDGDKACILWSMVERKEELNSIRKLTEINSLMTFLFNELAVNVAWSELPIDSIADRLSVWADKAVLGDVEYPLIEKTKTQLLDRFSQNPESDNDWLILEIGGKHSWKSLKNYFVTAAAASSLIDPLNCEEGNQQEQLAVWLTDSLQSSGVCHSPQIPKGRRKRELIDILLSYEFGTVLIESKTLSVLARERLPDRAKLKKDISAHITKAFKQLGGAIKSIKSDLPVTTLKGDKLNIEREYPLHAIVLIPDLDLIEDREIYGLEFMQDFMKSTGGIPHLLDISELLRVVQVAEMLAAEGKSTTRMMAFDYYLIERMNKAVEKGSICIEMLFRMTQDADQN